MRGTNWLGKNSNLPRRNIFVSILLSVLLLFSFTGCEETATSSAIGVTYGVCSKSYNCQYGTTFVLSDQHGVVEITLIASAAVTTGTSPGGTLTLLGEYGPKYTNSLPGAIVSLFSYGVDVITTAVVYDTRYYDEHQDEVKQVTTISHILGVDATPVIYSVRLLDDRQKEITRGTIPIGQTTMAISSNVHYIEVTAAINGKLVGLPPMVGYDNAHELSEEGIPSVPNTAVNTAASDEYLNDPIERVKAKMESDGYDTSIVTFENEGEEVVEAVECYVIRASWEGWDWNEGAQEYFGGGSYAYAVPKNPELDVTLILSKVAGGEPKPL
jgi:hypothetical protein